MIPALSQNVQRVKRRYAEKNNVLLVNITRLGDMLQATPAIAGMKMENPQCKITVVVEKQFEQICHWLPNIDEVISLDLGYTVRCLARSVEGTIEAYEYIGEFVDDLRRRNFDYCLNMSSSAYTALLLKLVGVDRHGGWMSDEEGYRVIESDWAKLFATSVFHQNRQYNSLNLVDIFRCSADVEKHPEKLQILINDEALGFADEMIANAGFTNRGPLVVLQAGASQRKRQWEPKKFIRLVENLVSKYGARVILTGTKKELAIIDPIREGVDSENVLVLAGKTDIPQLAAVLHRADVLVTGDTGPMHIAVAAGTPVVAMFLASAFGFETGPYSAGNIVLQPIIGCGPCNPNKLCARPDCHNCIDPDFLAALAMKRAEGDFHALPENLQPTNLMVYRSEFDSYGFCDLRPLNTKVTEPLQPYRDTYRKLWLEQLGGFPAEAAPEKGAPQSLRIVGSDPVLAGLPDIIRHAQHGQVLIKELTQVVQDIRQPASKLRELNDSITELDRTIEQIGFHYAPLGPVTRMFIFGKENIAGNDAMGLARQMFEHYKNLEVRAVRFAEIHGGG